ncbi:CPBP family intramembrane metalloprotease [Cryobacterium melibiosiphilum]|uniref:CPBP family intramembrane metalloprotease n=1 Tax=Cryobacterium melibiosiphilum TaxID=995039 RepID=A0A3A5MQT5_9MICO|nr:type II CAAX endopeptidase family protein [Cryobacterium melibiosiphilum]RJT92467.1 CPBP family intramembrane metalloprotease [Cryobacterium melibiosiphilum]
MSEKQAASAPDESARIGLDRGDAGSPGAGALGTGSPAAAMSPSRALTDGATGVVAALALVILVSTASARFWITDPHLGLVLSYLAVWVPLLAAVAAACYLHGTRSLRRDLGLWFHPLDLLWGLAVGLLARVVASLIEIAGYGQMGSAGATFGETVYDLWWLFGALLAPVLLAPLVEELFFRGVVLRAVTGVTREGGASRTVAVSLAIVVSALVFALVHIVTIERADAALVVGLSTFVFGVGAAVIAATTGRLGGAIIAHITFNGLVVVPALF